MSNLRDVKPRVAKITLNDGVERELRFTLNAMAELEEKYGSIDDAFKAMDAGSMKAIRCVLWAGLLHSDENLTERQVGDLIDMNNIAAFIESMSEALSDDMPDKGSDTSVVPNE